MCTGDRLTLTAIEATSDPRASLDLGYDLAPFTAQATLTVTADIAELGWSAGRVIDVVHTDMASFDHPGALADGPWQLTLSVAPERQAPVGLASLTWTPGDAWSLDSGTAQASGAALSCAVDTLHATPDTYLLSLFP